MNSELLKQRMIGVCERNTIKRSELESTNFDIVFEEPYIPYLPEKWNGFLVLAEVQNLSSVSEENRDYKAMLKNGDREYRILRLGRYPPRYENKIGVGPWDDKSLKLACASVFPDQNLKEFSVSNAVLWSLVDAATGKNINPTPTLKARSRAIWEKFIETMKPKLIITAGKAAHEVIEGALKNKDRHIKWAHPTPNYIGRISYLFPDVDDLLERFDNVNEAFPKVDLQKDTTTEFRNKVFYACHCINTSKRFSKK